jgi:hypothetical protein
MVGLATMNEAKGENVVSIEVVHFVDRAIENERRLTKLEVDALKELLFQRLDFDKTAGTLAYTELQRRLGELNHAHDNMVADREKFLPRETYDQAIKDWNAWRASMNTFRDNLTGKIVATGAVIGLFIGVILFLLQHLWK